MTVSNTPTSMADEFGMDLTPEELAQLDPYDRQGLAETGGLQGANGAQLLEGATGKPAGTDSDGAPEEEGETAAKAPAAAPAPAAPAPAPAAAPVAAPAAEAPAAAPAAAAPAEPAPLFDLPAVSVSTYSPTAPKDAGDQIKALSTKEADAFTQMMDGTLTAEAYQAVKMDVAEKLEALRDAISTDKAGAAIANNSVQAAFGQIDGAAQAAMKAAGLDLTADKDASAEYYGLMKTYAEQLMAKGIGDGADLKCSRMAVEKATRAMLATRGLALPAAKAAPVAAPAAAAKPAGGNRVPDLTGVPPTLAHAPIAGAAPVGGDEFGAIDQMTDPDEIEKAIAHMNPEQYARYSAR